MKRTLRETLRLEIMNNNNHTHTLLMNFNLQEMMSLFYVHLIGVVRIRWVCLLTDWSPHVLLMICVIITG